MTIQIIQRCGENHGHMWTHGEARWQQTRRRMKKIPETWRQSQQHGENSDNRGENPEDVAGPTMSSIEA